MSKKNGVGEFLGGVAKVVIAGVAMYGAFKIAEEIANSIDSHQPCRADEPGERIKPDLYEDAEESQDFNEEFADVEIEEIYNCPIAQTMMIDPYILTNCGHSFEKCMIVSWLEHNETCPLCHRKSRLNDLIPNFTLKDILKKKREEIRFTNFKKSNRFNAHR
jgi:hypothetical protein